MALADVVFVPDRVLCLQRGEEFGQSSTFPFRPERHLADDGKRSDTQWHAMGAVFVPGRVLFTKRGGVRGGEYLPIAPGVAPGRFIA